MRTQSRSIPPHILKKIERSLSNFNPIFRLILRYRGAEPSPNQPKDPEVCRFGILKSSSEYKHSISALQECGLHLHPDHPKNWDAYKCVKMALRDTSRDSAILDAGGGIHSPFIEWLYMYGYEDLHVVNIDFASSFRKGTISYENQDLTNTTFPSNRFDIISLLSVIEHGVDEKEALDELYRLLKPGGKLIVSTDFWPGKINDEINATQYGKAVQEWTPYNRARTERLLKTAEKIGFTAPSDRDYSVSERVVSWKGESFTFMYLVLESPE